MQNSLRFRLTTILIILAVGPLLLVGGIIAQRSFTFEQEQAYTLQSQVAQNVAAEVDAIFVGINNDLNSLGNEIRSLEAPDQAQQLSLMLRVISSGTYNDYYDELTLLDPNGVEIVRLSPQEIVANSDLVSRANRDEFKQPATSRSTYYSTVETDSKTGKSFTTISIPLYLPRSTTLNNVLVARIKIDAIGNTFGNLRGGENQTIYLTDADGNLLAHQDRTFNLGGHKIQLPPSTTTQDGLNGNKVIIATQRILLGGLTLFVVTEKPVSIALKIANTITATITVVTLLALGVAAGVGSLAIRQIVVPIENLASLAEVIAGGDLTQKAPSERRDELGVLARAFNSMTSQLIELIGDLEQRVEERTRDLKNRTEQLEAVADVARSVATIRELDQLLPAITHLVSERFGFYHVGIFLLDNYHEFALLRAANSEGGARMLARDHRLKVGEQGIIGHVTYTGNPRIALDVGEDAVYFDNPDLPETHSEVGLPLKYGTEIIGALDIQSKETHAFTGDDLEIFSILADQVSVAIQNARSLEETRSALREVEIATNQLTGTAWRDYTEQIKTQGYRYDGIRPEPLKETTKSTKEMDVLMVPVELRGHTIGRLKLKTTDRTRKWTDDELAIIESTAERVAIALEGARLLEDAQKRASRESFLSGVAAKLGSSVQLDSILRDTVEELGQILKDSRITFQLVNPSAPPFPEKENGYSKSGNKPEQA